VRLRELNVRNRAFGSVELSARRAVLIIATVTTLVTVVAGVLMRYIDEKDFTSIGQGLWWAVQTVTTVGYGDDVPTSVGGRLLAALVMLTGIGFISVVTASVTAGFVEAARRRMGRVSEQATLAKLDELAERLERIEKRLQQPPRS
jgi:voltage-gated potassium channel